MKLLIIQIMNISSKCKLGVTHDIFLIYPNYFFTLIVLIRLISVAIFIYFNIFHIWTIFLYCTIISIFVHLVALMFVGAGMTFLMSTSDRTLTYPFVARRGERTAESWEWTDGKLFPAKVGVFVLRWGTPFSLFVSECSV